MDCDIREITDRTLDESTAIIREAFGAVTGELGITKENCHFFPAYLTVADINKKRDGGARCFGAFIDGRQVGVVIV